MASSSTKGADSGASAAILDFPGYGFGPGTPGLEFEASQTGWRLIADLLGGTSAMVKAGRRWLPKEKAEEDEDYEVRLHRNTLDPVFKHGLRTLANAPFQKPPVVSAIPDVFDGFTTNVDMRRTSLARFGQRVFSDAVRWGRSFIYVDMPDQEAALADRGIVSEDGQVQQQQLESIGSRMQQPRWLHYRHGDVISIKRDPHTHEIVACRLLERVRTPDPDNDWGEIETCQIREVTTERITVYRWNPESDGENHWQQLGEPVENRWGVVPLVPVCPDEVEGDQTSPPMLELAEVNLAIWRASGDYNNVLRFAGIPFLQAIGDIRQEENGTGEPVKISTNALIEFEQGAAGMSYVEVSGASVDRLSKRIEELKDDARQMGMMPFVAQEVQRTATETEVDEAHTRSVLQSWGDGMETALNQALEFSFIVLGRTDYDAGRHTIRLQQDYRIAAVIEREIGALADAVDKGTIPPRLLVQKMQEFGIVPESEDPIALVAEARRYIADLGRDAGIGEASDSGAPEFEDPPPESDGDPEREAA